MPRTRSLVKAFDLIPVVEQVLPDRQKTEVRRSDLFTDSDVVYLGDISLGHDPAYPDSFITRGMSLELITALCIVNLGVVNTRSVGRSSEAN